MPPRNTLLALFSTFADLQDDRIRCWISDARLQRNMIRHLAQTPTEKGPEDRTRSEKIGFTIGFGNGETVILRRNLRHDRYCHSNIYRRIFKNLFIGLLKKLRSDFLAPLNLRLICFNPQVLNSHVCFRAITPILEAV